MDIWGLALMVTVTAVLGLSQLPDGVCVTYQVVGPGLAVLGVGAVASPVPPVAAVYQSKLALRRRGRRWCPGQYGGIGLVVGAVLWDAIVTVMGVRGLSQLPVGVCVTYQEVGPGLAVLGVGAVGSPVPLVAVVYQEQVGAGGGCAQRRWCPGNMVG